MNVADVLTEAFAETAPLRRPVLVVGLRGWFDVADAATDALRLLADGHIATVVASIDPDPFYDFTQERPIIEIDEAEVRHVRWPTNEFRVVRFPGTAHDLVVLAGVEPHLRYATFADCIVTVARELHCEMAITVGATPEAIAHTRPPEVIGSSTSASLAAALDLSPPRYQGTTGLIGVLLDRFEVAGMPAVSLRVGVPHYLGNAKHPASSAALLTKLGRVLSVPTGVERLDGEIVQWRRLHDEAAAEDEEAASYVEMLEHEHDRRAQAAATTGDELAAELERFLRDHRDDPDA